MYKEYSKLPGNLGFVFQMIRETISEYAKQLNFIQLFCFWTLSIVLLLFKAYNVPETGFCLRLQVEPTQLGPIDRATGSPYLRTQTPIKDSIYKPSTAYTICESYEKHFKKSTYAYVKSSTYAQALFHGYCCFIMTYSDSILTSTTKQVTFILYLKLLSDRIIEAYVLFFVCNSQTECFHSKQLFFSWTIHIAVIVSKPCVRFANFSLICTSYFGGRAVRLFA
jgi:hypothetical protein